METTWDMIDRLLDESSEIGNTSLLLAVRLMATEIRNTQNVITESGMFKLDNCYFPQGFTDEDGVKWIVYTKDKKE